MKKIGLLGLSNPVRLERIQPTITWFKQLGHQVDVDPSMFQDSTGQERAQVFNTMMRQEYDFIFDVSGGDLANETIAYLDLDAYAQSHTIFHGYSDVTCVLNVLAPIRKCGLFQICGNTNKEAIQAYVEGDDSKLFIDTCIGGNIRCFLKLAGTSYFPNVQNQALFLESRSGNAYRIRTFLAQLDMMHVFEDVERVCIGEFTELGSYDCIQAFFQNKDVMVQYGYPVGHACDSKAIWIGSETRGS